VPDVSAYLAFFLVLALFYALVTLGLNLHWGVTGLLNVGVAGFVAVGAYASALLTGPDWPDRWGGAGWPVAAGWAGAMLAAGACALVVGAITLRLREDYLAIATFGIAVTLQLLALNAEPLTGGPFGLHGIPRPFHAWVGDPGLRNLLCLGLVAGVVAAAYALLERLVRSPWGRVLRGIREDETAAVSLGKAAAAFRLQAFVLGAMLMGLGGAVYAHFIGYIAPEDFLSILTFQAWSMLIVGGSGNNRGAILGALAVWALWSASGAIVTALLPQGWQARGGALQVVLVGLVLSATLVARPRGLLGEEAAVSRHVRDSGP
jgi:branched-chain amino acid transport system permease protein